MTDVTIMTIIVAPIDGARTTDSVEITADCGCQAWIAPTGLHQVLSSAVRTRTVCMRHVDPRVLVKQIRAMGGLRSLPGARAELEATLGKQATDDLYRDYNIEEWLG